MPSPLALAAMLPVAFLAGWSFGLAVEGLERLRRIRVQAAARRARIGRPIYG